MFKPHDSLDPRVAPTVAPSVPGGWALYTTQNLGCYLPKQWHHYMTEPDNCHSRTFTCWIAALSAAPTHEVGLSEGPSAERRAAGVCCYTTASVPISARSTPTGTSLLPGRGAPFTNSASVHRTNHETGLYLQARSSPTPWGAISARRI